MKCSIIIQLGLAVAFTCPSMLASDTQVYSFTTIAGFAGTSGSVDGSNSAARFNHPRGIAVDGAGDVYVAEHVNNTIRKLTLGDAQWVTTTIVGLAGTDGSADGTNRTVRFENLNGVAVDSAGNLYVADYHNNTIRKLTREGTNFVSSTIAGLPGSPGSADGTNQDARFSGPVGVALNGQGNLYVADWFNHTIRELTAIGTDWVTRTIAGQPGVPGSTDGTNSAIQFNNPFGVAAASDGALYVTEVGNSVVRQLTPIGTDWVSHTIAGVAGSPGSADGTNSAVRFNFPAGVGVDSAMNVYIADWDNMTLRKLSLVGTNWVSSTVGGLAGSAGSVDGLGTAARFGGASGVAVDRQGNLYVTDEGNDTIRLGAPISLSGFAPAFRTVERTSDQGSDSILFTWSAVPGLRYQLQSTSDLSSTNWVNLGSYIATGATIQAEDMLQDGHSFYRLLVGP
jgi:hypothetical protein